MSSAPLCECSRQADGFRACVGGHWVFLSSEINDITASALVEGYRQRQLRSAGEPGALAPDAGIQRVFGARGQRFNLCPLARGELRAMSVDPVRTLKSE